MSDFDPTNLRHHQRAWSRRTFLGKSAQAIGALALGSLLDSRLLGAAAAPAGRWQGILPSPHFLPRAKRIIHLCMAGGPSHVDLFDPKPELNRLDGKPFPESFTKGQQLAQLQNTVLLARGSPYTFSRCGLSGQIISDLLPHTQTIADDICIVRSMHTEQINHDPAHAFMNAGSIIKGRPSMGSWLLYGLGSEADNLPGYIVLMLAIAGERMLRPALPLRIAEVSIGPDVAGMAEPLATPGVAGAVGLLIGLTALVGAVAAPAIAFYAFRRVGIARSAGVAFAVGAVAAAALAVAPTLPLLAVAVTVIAAVSALLQAAVFTWLAERVAPARRSAALSLSLFPLYAGNVAGLAAASIAARAGSPREGDLLALTPIFTASALLLAAGVVSAALLHRRRATLRA